MSIRKAANALIDAIDEGYDIVSYTGVSDDLVENLRKELAQDEGEHVAWIDLEQCAVCFDVNAVCGESWQKVYTHSLRES
jgi:hypothetical protein